jgi:hypothetical protein
MAKNKKNIADFQRALQSKAQFIIPDSENEKNDFSAIDEPEIDLPPDAVINESEILEVDEEIAGQLKILAEHSGRSYDELVRHALSHFLMLKGLRLRDALMELYKKEISLKDL